MSSVDNTSGKMNSITRRLCGTFVKQRAVRILVSTVLLFVLACAGWLRRRAMERGQEILYRKCHQR